MCGTAVLTFVDGRGSVRDDDFPEQPNVGKGRLGNHGTEEFREDDRQAQTQQKQQACSSSPHRRRHRGADRHSLRRILHLLGLAGASCAVNREIHHDDVYLISKSAVAFEDEEKPGAGLRRIQRVAVVDAGVAEFRCQRHLDSRRRLRV